MFDIAKPKIKELEKSEDNSYGRYEIEPLERGYGTTLGNVLRRIMLSSLPGTAISFIKIDGVLHEFMPLPGMKEDVLEFIANLKKVNFRNPNKNSEEKYGYLSVKGKRVVKAGDIEVGGSLEIVNPDLVIANLGMDDANLTVEFIITDGYGYQPAQKKSDHADYIPIDAIYSPVVQVMPKVESTRVGHDSNYDKLTISIETDGTISPRDAISMAGQIVADQMQLFINYSETEEAPTPFIQEEDTSMEEVYESPIEDLELSLRTYNALKNAGIESIGELLNISRDNLLKIKNLGEKSVDEILTKLMDYREDTEKNEG